MLTDFVDKEGICTMGAANIIQCLEGKLNWSINKSTPAVHKKSRQLFHDLKL